MKKVWKYILSLLFTIIVSTIGITYYYFSIKEYDTEDEKIKEIVEAVYEIILPGESIDELSLMEDNNTNNTNQLNNSSPKANNPTENSTFTEKGQSITSNNVQNSDSNPKEIESEKNTTSNPKPTSIATKTKEKSNDNKPKTDQVVTKPITQNQEDKITAENIKAKYRPVFLSLQSQANGKLDALVGAAISEYQSKKAKGESISYSYFYQKYYSAGRALEANTDGAFYYVYDALLEELKKHGFDSSHAADFKQTYANSKEARESSLIGLARQGL
jgi:hypothetical protein